MILVAGQRGFDLGQASNQTSKQARRTIGASPEMMGRAPDGLGSGGAVFRVCRSQLAQFCGAVLDVVSEAGPCRCVRPVKAGNHGRRICSASDSYIWRYLSMLRVDGSSFRWFQNRAKDENP